MVIEVKSRLHFCLHSIPRGMYIYSKFSLCWASRVLDILWPEIIQLHPYTFMMWMIHKTESISINDNIILCLCLLIIAMCVCNHRIEAEATEGWKHSFFLAPSPLLHLRECVPRIVKGFGGKMDATSIFYLKGEMLLISASARNLDFPSCILSPACVTWEEPREQREMPRVRRNKSFGRGRPLPMDAERAKH